MKKGNQYREIIGVEQVVYEVQAVNKLYNKIRIKQISKTISSPKLSIEGEEMVIPLNVFKSLIKSGMLFKIN